MKGINNTINRVKNGVVRTYKLKVYDVKCIVPWDVSRKHCEVFKSGKDIVLHILDKNYEDSIVERMHENNLLCIPDTIPSCGYYKITFFEI